MKQILLHITILLIIGTLPVFSQTQDTVFCGGEKAAYVVKSDYSYNSTFIWEDPVNGEILENYNDSVIVQWDTNIDSGRLEVTEVGLGGCEGPVISKRVEISNPFVELFNEEACANETPVEFVAGGDYENYEWHDGSTGETYTADTSGSVWVQVTDEYGCTDVDSANLTIYELPDVNIEVVTQYADRVFIAEDSTAFVGAEVDQISLDAGTWASYQWNTDEITSTIDVQAADVTDATSSENTSYYWVTVTDEHMCTNTDTMAITVVRKLDIPNAITPNDDGDNDRWRIKGLALYPNCSVQIFDRWGDLVYQTNGYDESKYWDGRDMNGKELPMDSYYYVIKLGTGEKPIYGTVTIIR